MPPQERLRELFEYKEEGILVSIKNRPHCEINKVVGSNDQRGYLQCAIDGKTFKVHRVIWALLNGPIPRGLQIDHINRIKSDNRIENLRVVTQLENAHNRTYGGLNKSGKIGVHWEKYLKKWKATIKIKGVQKFLGVFEKFEDACAARDKANEEINFYPELKSKFPVSRKH